MNSNTGAPEVIIATSDFSSEGLFVYSRGTLLSGSLLGFGQCAAVFPTCMYVMAFRTPHAGSGLEER